MLIYNPIDVTSVSTKPQMVINLPTYQWALLPHYHCTHTPGPSYSYLGSQLPSAATYLLLLTPHNHHTQLQLIKQSMHILLQIP